MSRRQWVAWRYVDRGDEKPTKPPINPHNGYGASHSDPATWGMYEQAAKFAREKDCAGVGYVISDDDDFTGADLDNCRDPEFGVAEDWAEKIIGCCESYTEVSPSGRGFRIIWRGKIDKTFKSDLAGVEVYKHKRFLTITGHHVRSTPTAIRAASKTEELLRQRVEEFRKMPAVVAGSITPPNGQVPIRGTIATALAQTKSGNFFREINSRALRDLGRWVPELFGSLAEFQPSTGAWRVSSKNLGRNLQEDLSIAPQGIVDFGVHDIGDPRLGKRTPIDLTLEFGSRRTAVDAALWLCNRMSIQPAALGWTERAESPSIVPPQQQTDPKTGETLPLILTAEQFVSGFTPPEYLVDGIMQRGYLYSLTARTGHGKTAVSMYLAQCVARDKPFHTAAVRAGTVLLLAGENPDDIRARFLVLADALKFPAESLKMRFIAGVVDIAACMPIIKTEAEIIGDLMLVIVDTAAAYFRGDDSNSNAQQGDYARLLRQLTFLPGKPAVLVNSHPIKNATKDNLLPMGGSAFLNEVDGNLTLWANSEKQTTLHWLGKFRGPEFEPLTFELKTVESERVCDSNGVLMPSVIAEPVSEMRLQMAEANQDSEEIKLLNFIARNKGASIASLAIMCDFITEGGKPMKSKVYRLGQRLKDDKLIEIVRGKFRITPKGEREIENEDH